MRYRIFKEITSDGKVVYGAEKRVLFWWKEVCEEYVEDDWNGDEYIRKVPVRFEHIDDIKKYLNKFSPKTKKIKRKIIEIIETKKT
jgi:hypothetical protein